VPRDSPLQAHKTSYSSAGLCAKGFTSANYAKHIIAQPVSAPRDSPVQITQKSYISASLCAKGFSSIKHAKHSLAGVRTTGFPITSEQNIMIAQPVSVPRDYQAGITPSATPFGTTWDKIVLRILWVLLSDNLSLIGVRQQLQCQLQQEKKFS
jgi:hypothetical protein